MDWAIGVALYTQEQATSVAVIIQNSKRRVERDGNKQSGKLLWKMLSRITLMK